MTDVPAHAVLRDLPVEGGELVVGGRRISQLAQLAGRTPFYVYDRGRMRDRIRVLRRHLPPAVSLHYAIKANPMPAVVAFMATLVDGLDVASGQELQVAMDAGALPADVSFAGPGKSLRELEQAVAAGVLLNVESMREIRLLAQISERSGVAARVALRVNPDFELKSSGMKMGGGPKQFGIDAEQIPSALQLVASAGLNFEGFHIFSGSQNLRPESITDAQTKAFELALRLSAGAPARPSVLNLGGGFGIPYFPGEQPLDLAPIGENLERIVGRAQVDLPGCQLVVELGRYLVGEAGFYVCRVLDKKTSRGEVFLITDGGLHHHLAASGNFGQVIRKNYPMINASRMTERACEKVSVVGPLCTPLDLLCDRGVLSVAQEGDLLAVLQSGAYGLTASPTAFLGHPPPVELLV